MTTASHYTRKTYFCTVAGGTFMREFEIRLRSVRDVQDFVSIATSCPYTVTIRDERNKINGKSFMEMFCLDFSRPLKVICDCGDEELKNIRAEADRFLVT